MGTGPDRRPNRTRSPELAGSRPGGTHKAGVVWHTQGSGKSITMTCFAARVMQEPAMQNPTIVATNVVQERKFSELLGNVIKRYQNRSIETAQVMEELVEMAKKFREAASRGESLGLSDDEVKFYDALATNESAVRELSDETLKKIAHELTTSLRQNISVDWAQRESVRAKLRLMVKRILRKYKYPPDLADAAVELVLEQAETIGDDWVQS